jgi:hypothetical protein
MPDGRCGGRGGRRSSWPPTPLARPDNNLLDLTDPLIEKEEEEVENRLVRGKSAIAAEPGRWDNLRQQL